MSDSQDFDPRFDPAFQRGYDGEVTTQRRRTGLHVPRAVPADQPLTGSVPAPGYGAAVPGASPFAPASGSVPPGYAAASSRPAGDEVLLNGGAPSSAPAPAAAVDAPAHRIRLVSGWTITIAVIAVVLILGGGWVVNAFLEQELAGGGQAQGLYVVVFGIFAAPLAIAVGVLALLGLLFLGAINSRRKDGVAEAEAESDDELLGDRL